jgi:alpha-ketoglutarate-dependent sulfate ester dioxygenase
MSRIDVRPVAGHIGAEIHGVDLARELPIEEVAAIRAALLEWKVVFFRDQHIGPVQQVAFARRFGDLTAAHPLRDAIDGFPEIMPVDRQIDEQEYGKVSRREFSGWHTDVTAVVNPPWGSILRAEVVPPYGGDTTWTSLVAAYEGLSAPLRRFADGLRAVHTFSVPEGVDVSDHLRQRIDAKPLVTEHPVVRVHPETGERALFVSPTFVRYIVGVSPSESRRIIDLFFAQITRPEYTVRFRWAPGSIAFWDNRSTAHLGPQDVDHLAFERKLHRVTLIGDVPVGPDGARSKSLVGEAFVGV